MDFTIEVERALRVLDGAILVLCSVSGVQSQSITVDRQMKRYRVPRIAFVNKMDRAGANYDRVAAQLKEKLNHHAVKLQFPIGTEDRFQGHVDLVKMMAFYFDGENGEIIREEAIPADMLEEAKQRRQQMIEGVAEVDDQLGELFLADAAITEEQLVAAIRRATIALKMTPVMCGSAYKNKGVQLLLNAVCRLPPEPQGGAQRGAGPEEQRGQGRPRVRSEQALRGPGVQAGGWALRAADVHAHVPGAHRQG